MRKLNALSTVFYYLHGRPGNHKELLSLWEGMKQ